MRENVTTISSSKRTSDFPFRRKENPCRFDIQRIRGEKRRGRERSWKEKGKETGNRKRSLIIRECFSQIISAILFSRGVKRGCRWSRDLSGKFFSSQLRNFIQLSPFSKTLLIYLPKRIYDQFHWNNFDGYRSWTARRKIESLRHWTFSF